MREQRLGNREQGTGIGNRHPSGEVGATPQADLLTQEKLVVDEGGIFVGGAGGFAEVAFGVERASAGGGVEGVETDGVGGPGAGLSYGMRPTP